MFSETTNMLLGFTLIQVFISYTSLASGTVLERKQAWYDAHITCQKEGAALRVPMTSDFSDLDPLLPRDGSSVWLGGRYVHTIWKWTDGCRAVRTEGCTLTSRLTSLSTLPASDPFRCLARCHTDHVAMQKNVCYCLTSLPAVSAERTFCDVRCEDNFDMACGGLNGSASVYSQMSSAFPWDSDSHHLKGECAFLHLPGKSDVASSDLRMRTDACDHLTTRGYKRFLCQFDSPNTPTPVVKRYRNYATWNEAADLCMQQGGQLLNAQTNQSLPLLFHPYIPEDYWVGLQRALVLKWINGSEASTNSLPKPILNWGGYCLAAKRGDKDDVIVTAIDCSSELSFVCDKAQAVGVQPPDSAQSGLCGSPSSRPSTSAPSVSTPVSSAPSYTHPSSNNHAPSAMQSSKTFSSGSTMASPSELMTSMKDKSSQFQTTTRAAHGVPHSSLRPGGGVSYTTTTSYPGTLFSSPSVSRHSSVLTNTKTPLDGTTTKTFMKTPTSGTTKTLSSETRSSPSGHVAGRLTTKIPRTTSQANTATVATSVHPFLTHKGHSPYTTLHSVRLSTGQHGNIGGGKSSLPPSTGSFATSTPHAALTPEVHGKATHTDSPTTNLPTIGSSHQIALGSFSTSKVRTSGFTAPQTQQPRTDVTQSSPGDLSGKTSPSTFNPKSSTGQTGIPTTAASGSHSRSTRGASFTGPAGSMGTGGRGSGTPLPAVGASSVQPLTSPRQGSAGSSPGTQSKTSELQGSSSHTGTASVTTATRTTVGKTTTNTTSTRMSTTPKDGSRRPGGYPSPTTISSNDVPTKTTSMSTTMTGSEKEELKSGTDRSEGGRDNSGGRTSGVTPPSGRTSEAPTRRSVTAGDLLPLYILIGILSGAVVVIGAVVIGVFRYRAVRNFTRRKRYARSSPGTSTFRSTSLDTRRSRVSTVARDMQSAHTVDEDPEFRFVENRNYR